MSALMFFYTLAILMVCVVTAVLSIAAYASSRRRVFIFGSGAFICYALEITEIFFFEYTLQNQAFPASEYYAVTMPVLRTAISTASQACIWLVALDILDRHSKKLFAWPIVVFILAEAACLLFIPTGPISQWLYYSMRQVFLAFVGLYAIHCYRTSKREDYRVRLAHFKRPLAIGAVLVLCIFVEDIYNILLVPMNMAPEWLTLYLSERNFSENIFVCFAAVLLIMFAYQVLSIRMKEAPEEKNVDDLERHIDDQMPFFCKTYKLSKREIEVMRLLVLGKNNQEIADELFLAVGTVKTHVHNILVKTGQKSREALVLAFWQN